MKLIKTDRRTRLHRDTLSDIMEVKVEGPSLNAFSPKQAIETWWRDSKTSQKNNEDARKQFSPGDTNFATIFTIIKVLHQHIIIIVLCIQFLNESVSR